MSKHSDRPVAPVRPAGGSRPANRPASTAARGARPAAAGPPSRRPAPGRRPVKRNQAGRVALVVVPIVVVAAVVVGVVLARNGSPSASAAQIAPSAVTGPATLDPGATPVADTSGIEGALAWQTDSNASGSLSHDHVAGPVTYAIIPPVGGPHNATWLNAGVYTVPVPAERAVHDLEHGAVWITYDPARVDSAQVQALTDLVHQQSELTEQADPPAPAGSNRYVLLSPWSGPDLPAPIVISSWGHQLQVDSPTDQRLQQFIDTFRSSSQYTPELGAPVDGIPESVGGRPAG